MQETSSWRVRPKLKQIVIEASRALARLDAERLGEMALSCEALNRDLTASDSAMRKESARAMREASREMAVFSRLLAATRANLKVMNRLRERQTGRLEYGHGHN